jgi:hypothetical protein
MLNTGFSNYISEFEWWWLWVSDDVSYLALDTMFLGYAQSNVTREPPIYLKTYGREQTIHLRKRPESCLVS